MLEAHSLGTLEKTLEQPTPRCAQHSASPERSSGQREGQPGLATFPCPNPPNCKGCIFLPLETEGTGSFSTILALFEREFMPEGAEVE